jgi:hypothetical protein
VAVTGELLPEYPKCGAVRHRIQVRDRNILTARIPMKTMLSIPSAISRTVRVTNDVQFSGE